MGITIAKKPELDIDGTRWVEIAPGAKILVGSTAAPLYKSHYALIQRHLSAIDAHTRVGTQEFNASSIAPVVFEEESDLLIDLVAKHLIKGWEGIDEADKQGVPAPYSPELCKALIYQMPSVYFAAIQTGRDIALRAEQKVQETVGKPLPPTGGAATGPARKTRKSAGSASA